ncbi:hypothetical protein KY285_001124 [Solanum tuberosum]|nr:hypothetical protein KY285_001124 [Solanum tuberosum]
MASVGRLLWQLAMKEDMLWIKLVHGVYMKNNDNIWLHTPPLDSSWYWKKGNALKVEMQAWYSSGAYLLILKGKYSLTQSYNTLLGQHIHLLRRKNWQQFHKELITALSGAMIYQVWRARNCKLFKGITVNTDTTSTQIKKDTVDRLERVIRRLSAL